jgi:hypothetical protein
MLKPPGTKHWKLKCDELLSSFAFKFNLRRCNKAIREQKMALELAIAKKAGAGRYRPPSSTHMLNPPFLS